MAKEFKPKEWHREIATNLKEGEIRAFVANGKVYVTNTKNAKFAEWQKKRLQEQGKEKRAAVGEKIAKVKEREIKRREAFVKKQQEKAKKVEAKRAARKAKLLSKAKEYEKRAETI